MTRQIVLSIDAMGGDRGPAVVISGMAKSAAKNPDIRFLLHGDPQQLEPLLRRRPALDRITEIRPCSGVIAMGEKPSHAVRHGKGSSMWNCVDAVARGEAAVAVSCGNTGALMALSMLRMRRAPGIDRPAIAVLWPSRNRSGYNIVLDVGADVRADAASLSQYAIMGAEYARVGLHLETPRVGLLNVGTEDHKGGAGRHEANATLARIAEGPSAAFTYHGFVEGGDITGDKVDVIVTDGFTGNIALKTAEGTASLIGSFLSEGFRATLLSRIAAIFAFRALQRLKKRIDPRRVNGGVFLGLNGAVVKSHGSADSTGFSAAIKLAFRMAQDGFAEKVAARVASGLPGSITAPGVTTGAGTDK
ncbi:phosphate acyltransferase PlsX [Paroceanicella profunda]|uniref:Phosphate acyltransferase n=1 Tax=Paroceanicella profunda TaxID=2579971 RepID=A0A5B8G2I4_9RHOB|nr:phosphate acyltransferase PlsX [Paroceanicella profunda]QDL93372.1 phosphate acyltransferase PlsX [Paroceanicella profunda]